MSLILGNLATTIVAEVPVLLERTLAQENEHNILEDRCNEIKSEIEATKQRINEERNKQQHLRMQLLRLCGPPPSKSGSIRERELLILIPSIFPEVDYSSKRTTAP